MATRVFQKNTTASTLSLSTWLLSDIAMVMSLLVHNTTNVVTITDSRCEARQFCWSTLSLSSCPTILSKS